MRFVERGIVEEGEQDIGGRMMKELRELFRARRPGSLAVLDNGIVHSLSLIEFQLRVQGIAYHLAEDSATERVIGPILGFGAFPCTRSASAAFVPMLRGMGGPDRERASARPESFLFQTGHAEGGPQEVPI